MMVKNPMSRCLFLIILVLLLSETTARGESAGYEPPSCEYGVFDAWFSNDGVTWRNTTIDYTVLKKGEPFYVKTVIVTKKDDLWVSVKFSETGETCAKDSSFEVVEGPSAMYEAFDLGKISQGNSSFTYIWKFRVKPDTNWVNGNAPLNVMAQFDERVNNEWESEVISFTVANIFILDELWDDQGNKETDAAGEDNSEKDLPGFEFLSVVVLLFITRKLFFD